MAKSSNLSLIKAGKAKKDEFYTQLIDIEKELKHYKKHFHEQIVYCNCDDPYESNFFKYFATNFNELGLKKLITTSYAKSPIIGGELRLLDIEGLKPSGKEPLKIEITKVPDRDLNGVTNLNDIEYLLKHDKNTATPLKEDGDFRSEECIELLKKADIVVTNPPFSLFREYVAQLIEYDKKFLIIGNKNAITYKEIFNLIKDNKLWPGMTPMGYDMLFIVPDEYAKRMVKSGKAGSQYKIVNGVVYGRSPSIWLTNLDTSKRHEMLNLYKKYSPEEHPKYDNYDAININKIADIPCDYDGVMGVPITFLDKYNPEQFEILGMDDHRLEYPEWRGRGPDINGKPIYRRIIIKKRRYSEN